METLWFYLVAVMIAVYVILDGFDLGAGVLHLFVARTDSQRRIVLQSIGPVWDGNEVWLLAGGGALVLAFPRLYASAFSGFYLPLMMVLWLLILRAISIEFRSHLENPVWRPIWDVTFSVSSLLLAVFLGAALGNVVRGVPLGEDGYFFTPLWTSFRSQQSGAGNPGLVHGDSGCHQPSGPHSPWCHVGDFEDRWGSQRTGESRGRDFVATSPGVYGPRFSLHVFDPAPGTGPDERNSPRLRSAPAGAGGVVHEPRPYEEGQGAGRIPWLSRVPGFHVGERSLRAVPHGPSVRRRSCSLPDHLQCFGTGIRPLGGPALVGPGNDPGDVLHDVCLPEDGGEGGAGSRGLLKRGGVISTRTACGGGRSHPSW